jgi:cellulose synthase/poly-beta-1,6-N-acetylglucosamine synthase-like glycosyltransferase
MLYSHSLTILDIGANIALGALALVYLTFIVTQTVFLLRRGAGDPRTAQPGGQAWPLISVLVPAYNEERVIEASVRSILACDYPMLELIVIDDGSADHTAQIVTRIAETDSRVVLLRQPRNLGKSHALNAGIAAASSEYLVVVDADTIPDPDFLRLIVAPLLHSDTDAVAGNVKVGNGSHTGVIALFQTIEYLSVLNTTRLLQSYFGTITTIAGAAGAMRRPAVQAVGGYRWETTAEDAELTLRLSRQGFRILYQPRAIVRTEAPSTWKCLFHQRVRWIHGNMQCIRSHLRHDGTAVQRHLYGFPAFVYENVLKPPLEFYRAVIPLLVLSGAVHWPSLYGYVGLLLLNVVIVCLSFRIEDEAPRELLYVPLQYAIWPLFLVFPYCAAAWNLCFRRQPAWRKSIRNGIPATWRAEP